jgi:3-methyladenine DNA glycosylase/8-oxoguanine DNA glycosylase
MGQPDALPASDLGLRRALADPGAASALPSAADVSARARAWRPWRALAAVHLWASGHAATRA